MVKGAIQLGIDHTINWKLRSDGDLWEYFHKCLLAKGHHSCNFTWVKGHATDEHVQKGITTEEDKVGNDMSDKAADIGAKNNTCKIAHAI